ncbi:MAG: hypothetical protein ABIV43_00790 [Candidatus Saccharimonadales bacterium]
MCAFLGHLPFDSYTQHIRSTAIPTLVVAAALVVLLVVAHIFNTPKLVTHGIFYALGVVTGILIWEYLSLGAVASLLWLLGGVLTAVVVFGGLWLLNIALGIKPLRLHE